MREEGVCVRGSKWCVCERERESARVRGGEQVSEIKLREEKISEGENE